jgi:hypothetical protein
MVNPEKSKLEQFREAVTGWLSVVTVVIGALFGLYKYLEEQRSAQVASLRQAETLERARLAQAEKDNLTRRIEAQKPFLELQFKTYLRTNSLVAKMILLKPDDPDHKKMRAEFDGLYWSELAMVEDVGVASAMVDLQKDLVRYEKGEAAQAVLNTSAIHLAHAFRDSIRSGWESGLKKP